MGFFDFGLGPTDQQRRDFDQMAKRDYPQLVNPPKPMQAPGNVPGAAEYANSALTKFRDARAKANPTGFMAGQKRISNAIQGSFEKGGKVKRTGIYKLHKGEEVLTKKKALARKMSHNKNHVIASKN